uniref:tRNA-specific adenosine deaminase 1 n=1 Tax=Albugo laibachii Nc14 TaxID=890382 RepID=F0WDA0_9STRA|nr:conserved hypothetical protein [Albugo laibachii Nc14]|eukprot:CCA19172.1 conserved hypothetical protein [Albugo laibachii Nc14]
MSTATRISDAVENWFQTSTCQKKYSRDDWTVLSGIVLQYPLRDSENDEFRVLACATGSKCVGRDRSDSDGFVVNDCHAEVLARRSFMRYLYHEAIFWRTVSNGKIASELAKNSIFTPNDTNGKFVLKNQHRLHVYISESPCGQASIYPLKSEIVNKHIANRIHRNGNGKDTEQTSTKLRKTGAKLCKTSVYELDSNAKVPRFRTKSGRSDIPPHRQTLSLSCSDKIAKWMILGIQGTLLTQWFDHVYLSSIVIGQDLSCESQQFQENAIKRSLWEQNLDIMIEPVRCTVVPSVGYRFGAHKRTAGVKIASIAVNWTECEDHWQNALNEMKPLVEKGFLCNIQREEILLAGYGIREGGRYPKTTDVDESRLQRRAIASRLSKASFYAVWQCLMQADKLCSYKDAKKHIWNAKEHFSESQLKYVRIYHSRNGRDLYLEQDSDEL